VVLGIDPSTACTGWGIINDDGELVAHGYIKTKRSMSNQEKITCMYDGIKQVLEQYNLTEVACENQYLGPRKETIKTLSQVRGVIMLACQQHGIEIKYYWPSTIKLKAAGKGNATKEEVISVISDRFNLMDINDNVADAIAIAYCHQKEKNKGM